MNLRDRLRLLKAAGSARAGERGAPDVPGSEPPPVPGPDRRDLRPGGGSPSACLLGGCIAGYTVQGDHGEVFYIETRYPVEHRRGPLPLDYLCSIPGSTWEVMARIPPSANLRNAVFLDTETTGLAGGTGTYAFLVGLGFFQDCNFVVRQYFLRDYGEEDALLAAVAADLAGCGALVTFNGKSFDWPLLETRFRMARRRPPHSGMPHLDLLHPARRIWKDRLQQCSLTSLEAQVLGVHRQGDVPGYLIPHLYFDYLRSGRLDRLADVVLHNRLDILSLVSLAGWMGHMLTHPLAPTPDGELVCGDDLFALGRLFEARGQLDTGLSCYEEACRRGLNAIAPSRAWSGLAAAYKRAREHHRALPVWERLIQDPGGLNLQPYLELAKYYEHVAREYGLAREMAGHALAVAEQRRSVSGVCNPGTLRELQDLHHRLARLERKLRARITASPRS